MNAADLLFLSLRTLRSNKLRSAITIAIIALGITALVGIITAIGAMNQKLMESFSTMGANAFTIRLKERNLRMRNDRAEVNVSRKNQKQEKKSNLAEPITLKQAVSFKEQFRYPASVSLSCSAGNTNRVATSTKKTSPTVYLYGVDENYLELNGYEILNGRNYLPQEIEKGTAGCILGFDVAKRLFGDEPSFAIDREVRIGNTSFRVIAVLKSKGTTFGFSRDNLALISYQTLVQNFRTTSFSIGVKVPDINRLEEALGEAEGAFRNIRRLEVTEENNFVLEQSNSLAEKAINSIRYVTIAVTIIGLITLIGAAIGLMNIMLVAVAERTKEVGLMKAIGARKSTIQAQFLSEAVIISIGGAVLGIVFGILLGNLFALFLKTNFIVPWSWIIYGMVLCTVVGIVAGLYPALKAGNLNPIEALRYE